MKKIDQLNETIAGSASVYYDDRLSFFYGCVCIASYCICILYCNCIIIRVPEKNRKPLSRESSIVDEIYNNYEKKYLIKLYLNLFLTRQLTSLVRHEHVDSVI